MQAQHVTAKTIGLKHANYHAAFVQWTSLCHRRVLHSQFPPLHFECVRIPPYEKENKASSGAEDDTKSAEVGTCKVGHRSDLIGGQSSV